MTRDEERDALSDAIHDSLEPILRGRGFVLLYQDTEGGTGILSAYQDPAVIIEIIQGVARVSAEQPPDAISIGGQTIEPTEHRS